MLEEKSKSKNSWGNELKDKYILVKKFFWNLYMGFVGIFLIVIFHELFEVPLKCFVWFCLLSHNKDTFPKLSTTIRKKWPLIDDYMKLMFYSEAVKV